MYLCIFVKTINMKIYMYTLSDPLTKEVKYVGKTKSIKRRLQSHIDYARNTQRKRRYVADWILGLLNQELKPIITIIEETNSDNWAKREIYWISHFKDLGFKLCNLTNGGESNNGYVYSEELKEIRRQARIGWIPSKSTRLKISKALSKKVECVTDNIIFNSMKEATGYSSVPKSTFHRKIYKGEIINGKEYRFI